MKCYVDEGKPHHYVLYNENDDNKSWIIKNDEILTIQNQYSWGSWYGWSWTKDGRYLYLGFSEFCEFMPRCLYVDVSSVYRLDLTTQQIENVLPLKEINLPSGETANQQYAIAFSHSGEYLVYSITGEQVFYIRDLYTNSEIRIQLDQNQLSFGKFFWSPDDLHLAFKSSLRDNPYNFSLWLFSIDTQLVEQLMPESQDEFGLIGWVDNENMLLHISGKPNEPFQYTYNITTKELKLAPSITMTPDP